eukprot:8085-Heterococcus_DN1.PRE.2
MALRAASGCMLRCTAHAAARAAALAARQTPLTRSTFHSTAMSSGGVHMKNGFSMNWRLTQELAAKNKLIREQEKAAAAKKYEEWEAAELEMFVANPDFEPPDRNADNQERWNQARKRIIHSNLFGPYPQAAAIDAVPVEETTRERRRRRR